MASPSTGSCDTPEAQRKRPKFPVPPRGTEWRAEGWLAQEARPGMRRMTSEDQWAEGKAGRRCWQTSRGPGHAQSLCRVRGLPADSRARRREAADQTPRPSTLLPQRDASVGVGEHSPAPWGRKCWLRPLTQATSTADAVFAQLDGAKALAR